MATTKSATFSNLLNQYLAYDLLIDEFKSADNWLLKNCNWDKSWGGGDLILPFQSGIANSVSMGSLSADTDVASASYVRAKMTSSDFKEAYGTLSFYSRDLFEHGKVTEQNFLKVLPDQLEQLMTYFKQTVSLQVLGGKALDTLNTANSTLGSGIVAVAHPERYYLNQKLTMSDGTITVSGVVKKVNKNTGLLSFQTTRSSGTDVSFSTMVAANTKVYTDGANTTFFYSLKDMLLPAAKGGSDSFLDQTKTDTPYTQPVLYDAATGTTTDWGSATAITKDDILNVVFHALMKGRQRGAKPKVAVMSYKNYHACLKSLEKGSGAYKNIGDHVDFADYSQMRVGGITGAIDIVGVREMDDDWIPLLDTQYLDLKTGKEPFSIMKTPDGLSYYTIRATTGYQYLTDIRFVGNFIYRAPHTACVIHSLPSYSFN